VGVGVDTGVGLGVGDGVGVAVAEGPGGEVLPPQETSSNDRPAAITAFLHIGCMTLSPFVMQALAWQGRLGHDEEPMMCHL
jgi:hypothetical protein